MIGFDLQQRVALSATVRELANLVAAALVVGQSGKEAQMTNIVVMPGIILLFVAIVVLLDWWGERKERQSRGRAA
jgi:L-lactate permease